jgi:trimeric autotransporter adhesin
MKSKRIFSRLSAVAMLAMASVASNAQTDLGAACGCPAVGGRPEVNLSTLSDAAGNLMANNTILDCAHTYILDNAGANTSGKYYVGKGKTITIAPGTVIKGRNSTTSSGAKNGGALIISRGGKIIAPGTASCPIVFTAYSDNLNSNLDITSKGLWGGLIILGTATNNIIGTEGISLGGNFPGIGKIEGFISPEPRIFFGAGNHPTTFTDPVTGVVTTVPVDTDFLIHNDDENSGVLTYVSIRHGGEVIGLANEINGLTLGSVGRGTTINHIEVVSNSDDGIEFFGGTVDLKYATVLFSDDDAFDWDLGWSGRGQFWVTAKTDQTSAANGDHGFEVDGNDAPAAPGTSIMSNPNIYNATFIGSEGLTGTNTTNRKGTGMEMKEETNGTIRNSILANFDRGANFANNSSRADGGIDAYDNWLAGTLKVECNTFIGVNNPLRVAGANVTSGTDFVKFFTTDGNVNLTTAPSGLDLLHAYSTNKFTIDDKIALVPATNLGSTCAAAPVDGFFTPAPYRGAFEAGKPSWMSEFGIAKLLQAAAPVAPAGCLGDLNNSGGLIDTDDFNAFFGVLGTTCP